MKLALCAGILLATACAATNPEPATAQEKADKVLAVALNRALVEVRDLPDIALIDGSPEIIVRSSIMNSPFSIRPAALPKIPGKKVLLLAKHDIDARAKRRDVHFVTVDNLKYVSDEAELTIGTGMATTRGGSVFCCCVETVRYALVQGVWTYQGSKGKLCP